MSADRAFTAAMVQMRTGLLPEPSLEQGTKLIREAAALGAARIGKVGGVSARRSNASDGCRDAISRRGQGADAAGAAPGCRGGGSHRLARLRG